METQKPSFLESLKAGSVGLIKGAAILGIIGFALGGIVGAALALATPAATALPIMGLAISFGNIGISIGALVGAFTGVTQAREVQAADPQDIINMTNMAFAQGVSAGRDKNVSQQAVEELKEASSTRFQDTLSAKENSAEMRR